MKKRQNVKKLALCRETLQALDENKLGKVFGATDGSDAQGCAGSYCLNASCHSDCWNTCGTEYC
jgi:hypothetical protein